MRYNKIEFNNCFYFENSNLKILNFIVLFGNKFKIDILWNIFLENSKIQKNILIQFCCTILQYTNISLKKRKLIL